MIILSAGHYHEAPGACRDGFCEHEEATAWVVDLYSRIMPFTACGITPAAPLPQKIDFIRHKQPTFAVEIHFNACGGCGARGSETLYYPGSTAGYELAQELNDVMRAYSYKDRGVKEGWYRMDRPGIKDYPGDVDGDEQPDYFLRKTPCPAAIIEPEFIDFKEEIQAMREPMCDALASKMIELDRRMRDARDEV